MSTAENNAKASLGKHGHMEHGHMDSKHRIAVLFPGQGSQQVGMLSELWDSYPMIEQTFTEASDALGFDLWQVCQDDVLLAQTQYTQPALLAASMALWRIIEPKLQYSPIYLLGHSLGEFSALCASGVFSLADAVRLVHQRGQFMASAVMGMDTKMAAILGLEDSQVANMCEQIGDMNPTALVDPANFNSPGQVVVAGNAIGVDAVIEQTQTCHGKKAVPLKVSVPSHCRLMTPACAKLKDKLDNIEFLSANINVIQNRHARVEQSTDEIKTALVEQLNHPVRWSESMQMLADMHIDVLIECGSGNVLSNLAKRQAAPIIAYPTDKISRLQKLDEILL